jgi:carboxylesterase type B
MAKNGNPNHTGMPTWPAYVSETKSIFLFDTPCRVENNPGAALREQLLPGAPPAPTGVAPTRST